MQRLRGLLHGRLVGRLFDDGQGRIGIAQQHGVGRRRMGALAALRSVPDEVICAIGRLRVCYGLPDVLPQDEVVDRVPQHAAGVNGVDIVDIAHHSGGSACQQGVCHREVDAVVHTQELAGLGVDEGVLQLAEAVGILEEARRLKIAGATVIKGIEGYATEVRGIDRRPVSLFTGVSNLPVLVTIVDQKENLEKLIPFLEKKATHALVLFEESTALVTDYMRQVIAKRQADGLEK